MHTYFKWFSQEYSLLAAAMDFECCSTQIPLSLLKDAHSPPRPGKCISLWLLTFIPFKKMLSLKKTAFPKVIAPSSPGTVCIQTLVDNRGWKGLVFSPWMETPLKSHPNYTKLANEASWGLVTVPAQLLPVLNPASSPPYTHWSWKHLALNFPHIYHPAEGNCDSGRPVTGKIQSFSHRSFHYAIYLNRMTTFLMIKKTTYMHITDGDYFLKRKQKDKWHV